MLVRRATAVVTAAFAFCLAATLLPSHFSFASAAATPSSDANVWITEFLPNPVGKDSTEWIELHNDGNDLLRLDGWSIDDGVGGSKPYPLFGLAIPAGGYLVVPGSQSRIVLNNDRDSVRLIAPDGSARENISYVLAPEGNSFALVDGVWMWSGSPTPGAVNMRPVVVTTPVASGGGSKKMTPQPTGGSGTQAAATTDLQEVIAKNDGASVVTEGVVTVPPGRLGTRTFALQVHGGGAGAIVRAYGSRAMPALAEGDLVRLSAKSGAQARGAVLLATSGDKITRMSGAQVVYAQRDPSVLSEKDAGTAVTFSGEITSTAQASALVMDDRGQKEISVAFPKGAIAGLKVGESVTVRGVLLTGKNGLEIAVAGAEAVVSQPSAGTGTANATAPPVSSKRQPMTYAENAGHTSPYAIGGGIVAAAVLIGATLFLRKRRTADTGMILASDTAEIDDDEPR